MTKFRNAAFGGMLLFLASCATFTPQNKKPTPYFADNGFGEGVAVVQHPAGEFLNGVTYVSYQGPNEDPYVAAYNHETHEWIGPFKAGTSILGKDPAKKIDSHGKPTMIIDDAGYIHIFYGGHGGVTDLHGANPIGDAHSGENRHAVSQNPYDITSWRDLNNVSPFGTYNQAIKMDNGDIYLFYRHGAHRSNWVYQKSTDDGLTFAEPVSFLKTKRRDDGMGTDSWYASVSKGRGDEIVLGIDYHYCWDQGAPRNNRGGHSTERKNLYFVSFDTEEDRWKNVKGEELTLPITKEVADHKALAVDTGDLWTFNGITRVDAEGTPHINAYIGEDIGWQIGGPKQASYFRWNGQAWVGEFKSGLPIGRGDYVVDGQNVSFLLSGIKPDSDITQVRWWESRDSGMSFGPGKLLLEFKGSDAPPNREAPDRPASLSNLDSPGSAASAFIRNAHPDARMIIAEKPEGSDWRRMYLVGDNGPVMRSN
ncbi:BNR-4 repeat-containing protein [Altererythrobacter ishigakiensis]|uniref:Putative BNR repeat neuraminidase n=1 Tax=Altererythrobacter ishigakiensis TaxID=476157 RepID=A0A562UM10_9SPHN|nr:BNR-4 repeat-containing protein [Altererythrobacter ishigakiensis]TWJ06647.1 putative BNR repeat neuraminidase [Altererythrobacter ishigakiensis]